MVRITSRDGLRPGGGEDAATPAAPAGRVSAESGKPHAVRGTDRIISHPGTYRYTAELNDKLTRFQQADAYVEVLAGQLENLKADLSQQLTQRRVNPEAVAESVAGVAREWQQRSRKSGGSIDDQLTLATRSGARQAFRIRGLDMATLAASGGETLTFFTGMSGMPPLPVTIPAGADAREILARFNQSLSRAGIQASQDEEGRLSFDIAEEGFAALQDQLSLRGSGNVFPAGQPNRVRLDADRPALEPARWEVADHAAIRRTLREVIDALDRVTQVRQSIRRALAQTDAAIAQLARPDEDVWAKGFATDFAGALNQQDNYSALASVVPALMGISRYRVVSLLAL